MGLIEYGGDRTPSQLGGKWLQIGYPLQVVLGLLEQDSTCDWFIYGNTRATQNPWGNSHSRENFQSAYSFK